MAEYTPVSKINYDLFKQNYDPNLAYNQQSQTIQQKYNEDLFNKYSGIASEEPKLGFFEKLGSGLESLFSAYGAEPDYVNPNLAEMLTQQNYQNTLAYSPMFDNRNRFKEDIIPERMIDAPMDLESTMAGSILDKGITNRSLISDLPNLNYRNYNLSNLFNRNTQPDFINAPQDYYQPMAMRKDLGMDTSYGVANEPDVEQEALPGQKSQSGGIGGLLKFLVGLAVPGAGFLMNLPGRGLEGIRSLNQRIQGSDFGQATSMADYLDMRKYGGAQGRRNASARNMAQARGITKSLASKPSSTSGGYQQGPGGSGAQTTSAKSKTSSPTNVGNPFGYR